jgi:cytochrome c biogenesis protein CcmG/thiol:disulfide interchange protein DsbE
VIGGFLAAGLKLDPREVPSPLIDKPAPAFSVPRLLSMNGSIGTEELVGRVWVLNVFASWCVACRAEHGLLNDLASKQLVTLVGLNYKDDPSDARSWLRELGNPYDVVALDYGVPETFVIDADGTIRFKHIGPVDARVIEEQILPLVRKLKG